MDVSSLAEDLQVAGLDETQATVYVRLLQTGPAKVGQISQYFDSSRSTLYRLLDELAEKGYVTKSLERPTVYSPTDPERLFELGLDSIERTKERLVHVRDQRLEDLQRVSNQTGSEDEEAHWSKMEGTERIYNALHEMVEQADDSFWSVSNHELSMARFLPAVEEAWRICARRAESDEIDIRLLMDFQDDPYKNIPEWLPDEGSLELRHFDADETVHFAVADESELLMWIRPAPLGTLGKKDDIAVRTNAPGSVFGHRMLFDRLWAEGELIKLAKD